MAGYMYRILILFLVIQVMAIQFSCKSRKDAFRPVKIETDSLAEYPYWIGMMDSPNVNYYKAVEAFDRYWANRDKPAENDGEGRNIYGEDSSFNGKITDHHPIQYVYEYKRFLNWEQKNKNLVKPDGTLMTPEEIIEQWRQSNPDTIHR